MLVWSSGGRIAARAFLLLLFAVFYALPLGLIVLASVTAQWNGVLPNALTTTNYADAFGGAQLDSLRASLLTGAGASLASLVLGTWAALAVRRARARRLLDTLFFLPSAVPSVSVGLGLLVAYSRPPILLNGTVAIVLVAHVLLIFAFAYGNISAGLARLPPDFEQVAESLGGSPTYVLRRVTLPLLAPQLVAAGSLGFALSMGELGATIMVYPPGWVTLPVDIFALTDRGEVFGAAALTVILATVTLAALLSLSLLPMRASPAR